MAPKRLKSYTANFKLSVIKRAEEIGNRAAGRELEVDERCIRRWRSEKKEIEAMPKTKRSRRSGRVRWPQLEDKLEEWVKEERDKGIAVSTIRLRLKAKVFAQQMGLVDFKGGPNWCYRFMHRRKLSMRAKTTVGQALPTDWKQKKEAFLEFVHKKISELGLNNSQIINMDEVPLPFDSVPSRTINSVGDKTISITTTGNERSNFTCILSCAANGDKLKPMLIFKRKTVPKIDNKQVIVAANIKGWMCEKMMLQWLDEVWRKRKGAFFQPKSLLILDSMRAHIVESVKQKCQKISTTMAVIPGGMTKILQPLDISINRSFKCEMRKRWERWMSKSLKNTKGKVKRASYEEIVRWVAEAWDAVKGRTVQSAFRKAGIVASAADIDSDDTSESECDTSEDENLTQELLELFNTDTEESEFEGFSE